MSPATQKVERRKLHLMMAGLAVRDAARAYCAAFVDAPPGATPNSRALDAAMDDLRRLLGSEAAR